MASFELLVNAKVIALQGEPNDSVLSHLHEQGLTAAKFGCGAGHCGACAVLLEGRVQLACSLTIEQAASSTKRSSSLVTLEGLHQAEPKLMAQLTNAFVANQAAQCGYCLSGILVAAFALLRDRPQPKIPLEPATVALALEGHLCRCGTHQRIVAAIVQASGGA